MSKQSKVPLIKDSIRKKVNGCATIELTDDYGNIWATIRIAELPKDIEDNTPRLIRIEGIEDKITVICKGTKIEEEVS